jgi:hypothetical protein
MVPDKGRREAEGDKYHLARVKGGDLDTPRGLRKVTVTR